MVCTMDEFCAANPFGHLCPLDHWKTGTLRPEGMAKDADTALMQEVAVTSGNAHDGRNRRGHITDDPGGFVADSACQGSMFRETVRARGGKLRVVVIRVWARSQGGADQKLAA